MRSSQARYRKRVANDMPDNADWLAQFDIEGHALPLVTYYANHLDRKLA